MHQPVTTNRSLSRVTLLCLFLALVLKTPLAAQSAYPRGTPPPVKRPAIPYFPPIVGSTPNNYSGKQSTGVTAIVLAIVLAGLGALFVRARRRKSPLLPIRGAINDLRTEYEGDPRASKEVWRFQLTGDVMPGGHPSVVLVEMKGWWFDGELTKGEVVEIVDWKKKADRINTNEVCVLNNSLVSRRIRARDTLRGVVSDYKVVDKVTRQKGGARTSTSRTDRIWTFRVQRHDIHGNTLLPVIVEMSGTEFSGEPKDGDEVELVGQWQPGEILKTDQVFNVTAGITGRTIRTD
jgi:hypothetical protein